MQGVKSRYLCSNLRCEDGKKKKSCLQNVFKYRKRSIYSSLLPTIVCNCVSPLFTLVAALGIVVLHIAPLHGHQLVHGQRLHDSRVPAPPRPLLHLTQTLHIPHTPEPQLAVSHPDSQHSGPGRLHHTSQPGEWQREPLQEHTGKRKYQLSIRNFIYIALFICDSLSNTG